MIDCQPSLFSFLFMLSIPIARSIFIPICFNFTQ